MPRPTRRRQGPAGRLTAQAGRKADRAGRLTDRIALTGGIALLALVLFTFRDYGLTWDEPVFSAYGDAVVRFWGSGFRDRLAVDSPDMRYYGGHFEALASVWRRSLPLDPYDARHLLIALWGLGGISACWRAARLLGGPLAGLLAGILLAITPGYWGQMFNNSKDLPCAAAFMWALSAWISWVKGWPKPGPWRVAEAAVATGIAAGIRLAGGLPWVLAILAIVVWAIRGGKAERRALPKLAGMLAIGGVLTWAAMIIGWPRALLHPFSAPLASLSVFSRFGAWDGPVLFAGRVVRSMALPWDYAPRLLFLTLPEPVILLLIGGVAWWGWTALRRRRIVPAPLGSGHLILAAAAVVPVLVVILGRSVLFNGIRHLTFVLPPLACLAGLVAAGGYESIRRVKPVVRKVVLGAAAILVAAHVATMAALHPYESVFYNAMAGGVAGAQGRYEMEYWGASFREGAREVVARLRAEGSGSENRPWRVFVCGPRESAMHYLPATYRCVDDPARADFFFVMAGGSCRPPAGRPAFAVSRLGVPLAWVLDLRGPKRVLN